MFLLRFTTSIQLFLILTLGAVFNSVGYSAGASDAFVEVIEITEENWNDVVPAGKEVDAIIGDLVLKNRYVTAVIAQPLASRHANMTVSSVAGCLIDFTDNEQPQDQLSAYYPGARTYPFRSWRIVDSNHQPVNLQNNSVHSEAELGIEVVSKAGKGRAELVVTYLLKPGARELFVEQTFRNTGEDDLPLFLLDEVRLDGGKEDQQKSPNGTAHFFWIDDRFWKQAYGISCSDREFSSRSDARRSLLRYGSRGSKPVSVLKPGEILTHKLIWHVAPDLCDIQAHREKLSGRTPGTTAMTILASDTPLPGARVELSNKGEYAGTLWSDGSGRIDQALPVGTYTAKVLFQGVPVLDSVPLTVTEGINVFDINSALQVGTLQLEVRDDQQHFLPCKVSLTGKEKSIQLDFAPESAHRRVKNLLYLHQGREEILLPVGEYEAILSHGPEYDAAFVDFTISPLEKTSLKPVLKRVVDTSGWISTDFHSHSSPSGDNTASQLGRVLNLLCEHIEFAPCTEHNRIDTYASHIKNLGIEKELASCSGMELTGSPLPLNHQNVFPLVLKPHQQDGGGPATDTSYEKQIQRAALWDNRSDKLVQQNHPDIGWLFFDKNGDGQPDGGYSEAFPFIEAIEVHPLESILEHSPQHEYHGRVRNNRMINWLQLLNQGYRITGVVNTDAHYNFHGSGGLRNWVKCSTDLPGEIKTLEIVHATEKGHCIMSNGPFLSVTLKTAEDGASQAIPGDEIVSKSGNIELHVRVQCPNWFDIDQVFVLVNGKPDRTHQYDRKTHADKFGNGVVKFDRKLQLQLKEDTHVVVVAAGKNSQLGPVLGPAWGKQRPMAVSNPIFIDTDGKGFVPNFDPIYGSLPVKAK